MFQRLNVIKGGCIAPNTENELKFWKDISFKNTVKHESGRMISMPPDAPLYNQWELSKIMKDEVERVKEGIFGKHGAHLAIDDWRICW